MEGSSMNIDSIVRADEVTSTQKSLSSSHDPGWNDPPKWAFTPTQNSGTTPIKRLLNKRVAFPLSSGSSGAGSTSEQSPPGLAANLPPPVQSSPLTSAPHAPLSTPTGNIIESLPSHVAIDKNEALKETVENLEAVLRNDLECSNKIEEVRRRLDAMKIMWKEDKLESCICEKVLKISKALRNNDVEDADKMHVSLMMEHAAVCNTWISCIRHMILDMREKMSQPSLKSALQDSHPYLLPQSVKMGEEK